MDVLNTFLASAPENFDIVDGLIVAAIGILMVFVILALIILSINLMNLVLDKVAPKIKLPKRKKKDKTDKADVVAVNSSPIPAVPTIEVDDKRVVAAITAAIMQALEEENDGRKPQISFRISSIKKYK